MLGRASLRDLVPQPGDRRRGAWSRDPSGAARRPLRSAARRASAASSGRRTRRGRGSSAPRPGRPSPVRTTVAGRSSAARLRRRSTPLSPGRPRSVTRRSTGPAASTWRASATLPAEETSSPSCARHRSTSDADGRLVLDDQHGAPDRLDVLVSERGSRRQARSHSDSSAWRGRSRIAHFGKGGTPIRRAPVGPRVPCRRSRPAVDALDS